MEHRCWLCGRNGSGDPLDRHHVYGGPDRRKSEKYGAVVWLCHHNCHIFGPDAVHQNAENAAKLQDWMQRALMARYNWSEAEFRAIFGKSYLLEWEGPDGYREIEKTYQITEGQEHE